MYSPLPYGSVTIFGKKREHYRGPASLKEKYAKSRVVICKRESAEAENPKKWKAHTIKAKAKLKVTFDKFENTEKVASLAQAMDVIHRPTARESIRTHDDAPIMLGKLQLGKVYMTQKGVPTTNFKYLQDELVGMRMQAHSETEATIRAELEAQKLGMQQVKDLLLLDEKSRWLAEDETRRGDGFQLENKTFITLRFTERTDYIFEECGSNMRK